MTARKLETFQDIYSAVCETVKIQLTDGVTLERIKRDINMIYVEEVMPYKPRAWWWGQLTDIVRTSRRYNTGTVSGTVGSASMSFSEAPANSMAGMLIKCSSYPEVYRILTHTAATTSFTIETFFNADMQDEGVALTGMGFKIWQDRYEIDEQMTELFTVSHERRPTPLEAYNKSQFDERVSNGPEFEGHPTIYTLGDFSGDGARYIQVYPSCFDRPLNLKIVGIQKVAELDEDDDEPIMPVNDRIVLFYGALSLAWARERNESESGKCWNLFMTKLNRMASKSGDAPQTTEMEVDKGYLQNIRYRRWRGPQQRRRWEAD